MKGKTWPAEWREFRDLTSGVPIRQLTSYLGHSHHFYFTNSGWYDNGRRLLFGSARDNQKLLCSLDISSGVITQLTEGTLPDKPRDANFLFTCLNPMQAEVYYWRGYDLYALDLDSLAERLLYEAPRDHLVSLLSCTADGLSVCTNITQDLSGKIHMDLLRGYVGFKEFAAARPRSVILQIAVDGSGAKTLWEEDYWLSHVNTSPTRSDLMTFCHEGPWEHVEQRLWGLNLEDGDVWRIRPQAPDEFLGHEYWMQDGETLGYHGVKTGGECFFGHIRYGNQQPFQARLPEWSSHFHSNDRQLFVSDGMASKPHLLLWRPEERDRETGATPRLLCNHGSSMRIQQAHAHPRFTEDGSQILFTSDAADYGNLYLVDVPEFASLPVYQP